MSYRQDRVARLAASNVALGDHRDAAGVVKPQGMARADWRRYVRLVLQLEAVLDPATAVERRAGFARAGCACVCEQCGLDYADHPDDVDPTHPGLTVLCDGSRVHL